MYFVMLSLNNGMPIPMVNEDGYPVMFKTHAEAEIAAKNNPLGRAYPYEIYFWNRG